MITYINVKTSENIEFIEIGKYKSIRGRYIIIDFHCNIFSTTVTLCNYRPSPLHFAIMAALICGKGHGSFS